MAQLVRRLGLSQEIVSQLLSALTEERLVEILSQSDLYTGNYRYRLSERGQAPRRRSAGAQPLRRPLPRSPPSSTTPSSSA